MIALFHPDNVLASKDRTYGNRTIPSNVRMISCCNPYRCVAESLPLSKLESKVATIGKASTSTRQDFDLPMKFSKFLHS
eukprot:3527054-Amphidinium_carterae.1